MSSIADDAAGVISDILLRMPQLRGKADGDTSWLISCPLPGHGKGQGDRNQSATLFVGKSGKAMAHCHAGCDTELLRRALGLPLAGAAGERRQQAPRVHPDVAAAVIDAGAGWPEYQDTPAQRYLAPRNAGGGGVAELLPNTGWPAIADPAQCYDDLLSTLRTAGATYWTPYTLADGGVRCAIRRTNPDGSKLAVWEAGPAEYGQVGDDGRQHGPWTRQGGHFRPIAGLAPYVWPAAPGGGGGAFVVCEGEKAAAAVSAAGLAGLHRHTAVSAGGAGSVSDMALDALWGRRVVLMPDCDAAGAKAMAALLARLKGGAERDDANTLPVLIAPTAILAAAQADAPAGQDAADLPMAALARLLDKAVAVWGDGAVGVAESWQAFYADCRAYGWNMAQSLPSLCAGESGLEQQILDAAQALADDNLDDVGQPLIFRREGIAVWRGVSDAGTPVLRDMTPVTMRRRMGQVANWYKLSSKGERRACHPPLVLAQQLAEMAPPELPIVRDIRCHPILTADGRLADRRGYDRNSYWYLEIPELRRMPADEALAMLWHIVCDFPFTDESYRTNWLAAALTPLIRPAVPIVPMALIGKPTPRTGSTLLAEVTSEIVTGAVPVRVQLGKSEKYSEEAFKALASAAVSPRCRGIMLLDNLEGDISDAYLSDFITAEQWTTRRLGRNDAHIVLTERGHTLYATANNARLSEEITKRTYPVLLDAQMENPDERSGWAIPDLQAYVRANRAELLSALCSLIADWVDAGSPAAKPALSGMGGFEMWRDTIHGILAHAGVSNFLAAAAVTSFRASAQTGDSGADLIAAWYAAYGSVTIGSAQMLELADGGDGEPLLELRGNTDKARAAALGKAMTKFQGRTYAVPASEGSHDVKVVISRRRGLPTEYRLQPQLPTRKPDPPAPAPAPEVAVDDDVVACANCGTLTAVWLADSAGVCPNCAG